MDEPSAGGDNDLDGDDEEEVGNDEDHVVSMEDDGEEPEGRDGDNLDEEGDAEMNENDENPTEEVGDDAGDDDGLYPTDDVVEMEGDEAEPHDDEPSGNDEASHSPTQVIAVTDSSHTSGNGQMDVTTDTLPPQPPDASSSSSSGLVASSIDIPIAPIVPGPILLPSLRGKLMSDGTLNICRGVWAMNDAAHENPDQCRYIYASCTPQFLHTLLLLINMDIL